MDKLQSEFFAIVKRFVLEKDRIASVSSTVEDSTDLSHFTESQFERNMEEYGGKC